MPKHDSVDDHSQLCDVVITVSYIDEAEGESRFAGTIVTRLDLEVTNCIADIEAFIEYVTTLPGVVHSERLGSVDNK